MIEAAYSIPRDNRSATALLRYTPSYKGFLVKRRPIQHGEGGSSNVEPLGELRVPVDRETPEPTGLSPPMVQRRAPQNLGRGASRGQQPPAAVSPIPAVHQTPPPTVEIASERRRKRSADTAEGDSDGRPEKRPTPSVIDLERPEPSSSETRSDDPAGIRAPWMPAFQSFDGGPITYEDSAATSAGVALGLLKAIGLPTDVKDVPRDSYRAFAELSQHLVLVSAALSS